MLAPGSMDGTYIAATMNPDTNEHIFRFRKPESFGGVTDWSVHITCDDSKKTTIKESFNTTEFANQNLFIKNDKICALRVRCEVSFCFLLIFSMTYNFHFEAKYFFI